MSHLVSAEEARGLLLSVPTCALVERPGAIGRRQLWMDDAGDLRFVADINCNHGDYRALFAAAPDLAATVIALSEERDRLRDVLACERGESAPEGWEWLSDNETWAKPGAEVFVEPYALGRWQVYVLVDGCARNIEQKYAYAIEAIEAADRAAAPK